VKFLTESRHFLIFIFKEGCIMANIQGRRHFKKSSRRGARVKIKQATVNEFRFVYDDDDYVWENHVIGRLPFKEPDDVEIIFHEDKLWQDVDWTSEGESESSSEDEEFQA
jgi:hypothetical protein